MGSEDDRIAERLSQRIPVALIDQRTLAGLERLGAGSPVAESYTYYDVIEQDEGKQVSRLSILAAEKVKAAKVCLSSAVSVGPWN